MKFYIVERRKGDIEIEDANCFLGSSMDKVIEWINNNKDFDERKFYWWWVVIKITLDDEWGGELFKIFDWDGNELEEQPREQLNVQGVTDELFKVNSCLSKIDTQKLALEKYPTLWVNGDFLAPKWDANVLTRKGFVEGCLNIIKIISDQLKIKIMDEVKMILFVKWMATCYADTHLDSEMKCEHDEGFKSSEALSVLNIETESWYKEQLKHFNDVVYPIYIENGTVDNTKQFLK